MSFSYRTCRSVPWQTPHRDCSVLSLSNCQVGGPAPAYVLICIVQSFQLCCLLTEKFGVESISASFKNEMFRAVRELRKVLASFSLLWIGGI